MKLQTPRLELITADARSARAAANNDRLLMQSILGADIPPDWPHDLIDDAFPFIADSLEKSPQDRYTVWFIILLNPRALVGTVSFKSPPIDGRIDIGYGLVNSFQRRGYATEAARRLIELAFEDPRVDRIVAETLEGLDASIRVMTRCGFSLCQSNTTGFSGEENVLQYELPRAHWSALQRAGLP